LQREGVINVNPWIFIGSVLALKASSDLKPGEYSFQKNASLRDVIGTIVEGKVVQHAVTIPEGLTSEQIVARLIDNDIFAGGVREIPREGTLLPETYKFRAAPRRDQVIQRMQQTQKRVLAEIWERRNPDVPINRPSSSSCWPRSSRRKPARPTSAAAWRPCSSTGCARDQAAVRSDHHLRAGGRQGNAGRPIKRSEITQPSPYNTY